VQWIRAARLVEANRNTSDPVPAPMRRLSDAEYDYSVRDRTGVDMRPSATFPVDPTNETGFDTPKNLFRLMQRFVALVVRQVPVHCTCFRWLL